MKRYILALSIAAVILASCGGVSQGIKGKLTDAVFGDPIVNVNIKIVAYDSSKQDVFTPAVDDDGFFEQSLAPGNYRIEIEDKGETYVYSRKVEALKIEQGKLTDLVYKLDPIVKQWIHGTITDKVTKKPVAGATVAFDNDKAVTDKNGNFELRNYRASMKKLEITAKGYMPLTKDYRMSQGETAEDFEITSVNFVQGASVNKLADLLSYVLEITGGPSPDKTDFMNTITVNNLPFAVKIVTGKDEYVMYMAKTFKKSDQKYASIPRDEFESSTKSIFKDPLDMINSIFTQFNALKASINTDVIKLESGNIVKYNFKTSYNGTDYDCVLQLYFDGPNVGYADKLTLNGGGKYYEIVLKDINSPKNRIADPSSAQ